MKMDWKLKYERLKIRFLALERKIIERERLTEIGRALEWASISGWQWDFSHCTYGFYPSDEHVEELLEAYRNDMDICADKN